jgi:hypothetical protein
MNKEYAIWGIPPKGTEEDLLYTKATSKEEAVNICKFLEISGCKSLRIQVIDLGIHVDFAKAFAKTVTI